MAKIVIEAEDFEALSLVRGLEMILAASGADVDTLTEGLENVSEEALEAIEENYDEAFREEGDEEVLSNFIRLHYDMIQAVEDAIKKEEELK